MRAVAAIKSRKILYPARRLRRAFSFLRRYSVFLDSVHRPDAAGQFRRLRADGRGRVRDARPSWSELARLLRAARSRGGDSAGDTHLPVRCASCQARLAARSGRVILDPDVQRNIEVFRHEFTPFYRDARLVAAAGWFSGFLSGLRLTLVACCFGGLLRPGVPAHGARACAALRLAFRFTPAPSSASAPSLFRRLRTGFGCACGEPRSTLGFAGDHDVLSLQNRWTRFGRSARGARKRSIGHHLPHCRLSRRLSAYRPSSLASGSSVGPCCCAVADSFLTGRPGGKSQSPRHGACRRFAARRRLRCAGRRASMPVNAV